MKSPRTAAALVFLAAAPAFALDAPVRTVPLKPIPTPAVAAPDGCKLDAAAFAEASSRLALFFFTRPNCPGCSAVRADVDRFRRTGTRVVEIDVSTPIGAATAKNFRVSAVPDFYLNEFAADGKTVATTARVAITGPAFDALETARQNALARIAARCVRCDVPTSDVSNSVPVDAPIDATIESQTPPDDAVTTTETNADFEIVDAPDPADVPPTLEAPKPEPEPEPAAASESFRDRAPVRENVGLPILDGARERRDDLPPEPKAEPEPPTDEPTRGLGGRVADQIAELIERAVDERVEAFRAKFEAERRRWTLKLFFAGLGTVVAGTLLGGSVKGLTTALVRALALLANRAAKRLAAWTLDRAKKLVESQTPPQS